MPILPARAILAECFRAAEPGRFRQKQATSHFQYSIPIFANQPCPKATEEHCHIRQNSFPEFVIFNYSRKHTKIQAVYAKLVSEPVNRYLFQKLTWLSVTFVDFVKLSNFFVVSSVKICYTKAKLGVKRLLYLSGHILMMPTLSCVYGIQKMKTYIFI